MRGRIPISVLVATLNEEARLERCLAPLYDFADVWVIDSASTDRTTAIAARMGARVQHFSWNGRMPKKRQWALDHLPLAYDRVLFVDADEIVTPELRAEIAMLDWAHAGYFVRGQTVVGGRALRYGPQNNKLCLLDRRRMAFPVVDDLDIPGMGEMEGHYQPVPLSPATIGQLNASMLHEAYDDAAAWMMRHERYARWEAGMNAKEQHQRGAWPCDPSRLRQALKVLFRALPRRDVWAFMHAYFWKLGVLEGRAGWDIATRRARYYRMIAREERLLKNQ